MPYCPSCRTRVALDDVSTEVEVTALGEVAWRVEWLTCGHTIQQRGDYLGPAEGAPYAGTVWAPVVDPYPEAI